MVFQCINIRQVPWEVLKTAAFGLGFQHLQRELANVNAWKTVFDPYIICPNLPSRSSYSCKSAVDAQGNAVYDLGLRILPLIPVASNRSTARLAPVSND